VLARNRRILRRIIELGEERDGRRIFPLPAYRLPDRLLNRYQLLVPELAADTRRTRRPMLGGLPGFNKWRGVRSTDRKKPP